MYISQNFDEAFELMKDYPFATLISTDANQPFVSHLPLTPVKNGNSFELIGHVSRANPHWRLMNNALITVLFHGPQTSITPKWYANDDVPTWNYSVVHATGLVQLIETLDGVTDCLRLLTHHIEKLRPSGWDFYIPEDLSGNVLVKSIVGFKITIGDMNFKKKMSQNRSNEDRVGILKGLQSRNDEQSHLVQKVMAAMYTANGEKK